MRTEQPRDTRTTRSRRASKARSSNGARAKQATNDAGSRGPYARGQERREKLLAALLRLVAREGLGAVTHRSVAAEAGIPAGSVTHYFPKRRDLVRAAFSSLASRQLERIESFAIDEQRMLDAATVASFATENTLGELEDDTLAPAKAEFELILAISREPGLAPEYRAFQQRLTEIQEQIAESLGSKNPKRDGRIVQAFLRGVQLEALAAAPEARRNPRQIRRDLLHLLRALTAESN